MAIDEYAIMATRRMLKSADILNRWIDKWCIKVNTQKSATSLFTVSMIYIEKLAM